MSVYDQGPPPELMSMMGAEAPMEEAPVEEAGLDPDEQEILNMLQDKLREETDSAKQAALSDIIGKLAKILADEEDAQMSALGGNPKQLRAMSRAQQV